MFKLTLPNEQGSNKCSCSLMVTAKVRVSIPTLWCSVLTACVDLDLDLDLDLGGGGGCVTAYG